MPPFVQIGTAVEARFGGGVAGFPGDQYNPFVLTGDPSNPAFTVYDVSMPGGVDRPRFEHRMKALDAVDAWQTQMESAPTALEATDTFYLSESQRTNHRPRAKRAFDLSVEASRLRDR